MGYSRYRRWSIRIKMNPSRYLRWLLFIAMASLVILWKCFKSIDIRDDDFMAVSKCPACYGVSLCPAFHLNEIKLKSWTKYSISKYINSRNIYFATYGEKEVVVKKLGNDLELHGLDVDICHNFDLPENCKIQQAVHKLAATYGNPKNADEAKLEYSKLGKISKDILHCPSQRKLDFIVEKALKRNRGQHHKTILDNVLTMLLINSEPLILQTFPAENGWPFPHYFGSCGRLMVEEYVGLTLSYFMEDSFARRAYLAHQLLLIAEKLNNDSSGFILYITDISADNIAVDEAGNVKIVDLENVIIVDRLQEPKGPSAQTLWNQVHHSTGYDCTDSFCFSVDDLCEHRVSDHNIYGICQVLLSPSAYDPVLPGGLLHSIPDEVNTRFPLLVPTLEDCAHPHREGSRFSAAQELKKILAQIMKWRN